MSMSANAVWPSSLEKDGDRAATKPHMLSSSISLRLSPRALVVLWFITFILAFLNAAFLLLSAFAYSSDATAGNASMVSWLASVYLYHDTKMFLLDYRSQVGLALVFPAIPFVYVLMVQLWYSLRARRLSFGARYTPGTTLSNIRNSKPSARRCFTKPAPPPLVQRFMDRAHPYGIRGQYFKQTLLFIETAEVALQSTQAYRLSRSISDRFVNPWCGTIILLNCWTGPIVTFIMERLESNVLMERLVCILVDALLDFMWGTILQLYLIVPYVRTFYNWSLDHSSIDFDRKSPETANGELMQIFVESWQNYVLNIFSFVTSAIVLLDMLTLLKEAEFLVLKNKAEQINKRVQVRPVAAQAIDVRIAFTHRLRTVTNLCHGVVMLYGMVVFVITISSGRYFYEPSDSAIRCIDRLFPWFARHDACVGRAIFCPMLGIDGRNDELGNIISRLEPEYIARLSVVDCAHLEFPQDIVQLTNLATLHLYNVTVDEWKREAALTNEALPKLKTIYFTYTTFSTVPDGIVHVPMTKSLESLFFYGSNANDFIDLVTDEWNEVIYFACAECGLDHIPRVVYWMHRLDQISLNDNYIVNITRSDFGPDSVLTTLGIDGNPIVSLPDDVWAMGCHWLSSVYMQNTNISNVSLVLADDCPSDDFG